MEEGLNVSSKGLPATDQQQPFLSSSLFMLFLVNVTSGRTESFWNKGQKVEVRNNSVQEPYKDDCLS